jgi:hypothetical protein
MENKQVGRNEPCPCGSGKKYKQCCLGKDEAAEREARAKSAEAAPAEAREAPKTAPAPGRRQNAQQPWKRGAANTRGFQKFSAPRKVGGS